VGLDIKDNLPLLGVYGKLSLMPCGENDVRPGDLFESVIIVLQAEQQIGIGL